MYIIYTSGLQECHKVALTSDNNLMGSSAKRLQTIHTQACTENCLSHAQNAPKTGIIILRSNMTFLNTSMYYIDIASYNSQWLTLALEKVTEN